MSCYGWAWVTADGYVLGTGTNWKESVGLCSLGSGEKLGSSDDEAHWWQPRTVSHLASSHMDVCFCSPSHTLCRISTTQMSVGRRPLGYGCLIYKSSQGTDDYITSAYSNLLNRVSHQTSITNQDAAHQSTWGCILIAAETIETRSKLLWMKVSYLWISRFPSPSRFSSAVAEVR